MASYNERLRKVTERRDHALAQLRQSGEASAAIVSEGAQGVASLLTDTIRDSGEIARREIDHASEAISGQIDHAGDVFSTQLEHTDRVVKDQINNVQSSLNPASMIRAHPWITTIGVAAIGVAIFSFIKPRSPAATTQPEPLMSYQPDVVIAKSEAAPSWFKPITDALLAHLQVAAIALVTRQLAAVISPPASSDQNHV